MWMQPPPMGRRPQRGSALTGITRLSGVGGSGPPLPLLTTSAFPVLIHTRASRLNSRETPPHGDVCGDCCCLFLGTQAVHAGIQKPRPQQSCSVHRAGRRPRNTFYPPRAVINGKEARAKEAPVRIQERDGAFPLRGGVLRSRVRTNLKNNGKLCCTTARTPI